MLKSMMFIQKKTLNTYEKKLYLSYSNIAVVMINLCIHLSNLDIFLFSKVKQCAIYSIVRAKSKTALNFTKNVYF